MTKEEKPVPRRKTEQAIKISASWTPGKSALADISARFFGAESPLRIRGGRLTINAAVALDMTDRAKADGAFARVEELRKELEATGVVHSFSAAAGAVPAGEAEQQASDIGADEGGES